MLFFELILHSNCLKLFKKTMQWSSSFYSAQSPFSMPQINECVCVFLRHFMHSQSYTSVLYHHIYTNDSLIHTVCSVCYVCLVYFNIETSFSSLAAKLQRALHLVYLLLLSMSRDPGAAINACNNGRIAAFWCYRSRQQKDHIGRNISSRPCLKFFQVFFLIEIKTVVASKWLVSVF